jgi:seryl-tRNA synthetase
VAANDVLGQRSRTPKVIWKHPSPRMPTDVYEELLERGIASEAGEGQVALGEPVLSLMDHLDARIRTMVIREFGAREFRYPTLIPTAAMSRCGYFASFPQLMMFVSRLHTDVDTYRAFIEAGTGTTELAESLRAHSGNVDYCLPPTMCFHSYHQIADRPLPSRSVVLTSQGKSFRFESRYRQSLERLWDFTIREIVFLGPRSVVLEQRRQLMEHAFALMDELELGGRCEVANDPFFINPDAAAQVVMQQLMELKYELRLPLSRERDVAVASFNFHERFFTDSFGIRGADGEPAYTACAGFGLERLAYAFLCRHGVEPEGWPAAIREAAAL